MDGLALDGRWDWVAGHAGECCWMAGILLAASLEYAVVPGDQGRGAGETLTRGGPRGGDREEPMVAEPTWPSLARGCLADACGADLMGVSVRRLPPVLQPGGSVVLVTSGTGVELPVGAQPASSGGDNLLWAALSPASCHSAAAPASCATRTGAAWSALLLSTPSKPIRLNGSVPPRLFATGAQPVW